jgi:hypothetical protein
MKKQSLLLLSLLSLSFLLTQSIRLIQIRASTRDLTSQHHTQDQSDLSAALTVKAAGRGGPWINLRDGRDISSSYEGAANLEQEPAIPLALASGDFDEDGMADLLCGYKSASGGGLLVIHRRNAHSINLDSLSESPFVSPARVFATAEAMGLLGTGDFDADGHLDVVATAIDSHALYLLSGDGRGNLSQAAPVELAGTVTALVTGEMNRADGLTDVVVGILGPDGPKAMIFEGPEGALKSKPEAFDLPAQATALALGQLDDDSPADLAIAAGHDLVIVHGRDRKLSLEAVGRGEVAQAAISRRSFPFALASIAVGDFTLDSLMEVAMLSDTATLYLLASAGGDLRRASLLDGWSLKKVGQMNKAPRHDFTLTRARISTFSQDDLLIMDRANRQLHIFNQAPSQIADLKIDTSAGPRLASLDVEGVSAAVLPMRLNTDALSDLLILKSGQNPLAVVLTGPVSTFTVTNTGDSGQGSLRQAILNANANTGPDQISFNIPGAGPHTITPLSALPEISDPITINGSTQQGFAGAPIIELNGAGAGSGVDGLKITAGSSVVSGLVINRFSSDGIELSGNGSNFIEGNYIGTNAAGTADLGNSIHGLAIQNSNNTIGGTTLAARNIISGNDNTGVSLTAGTSGNSVLGNFIGTNATGTAAIGNGGGVTIGGQSGAFSSNTVGGTAPGARNIISGNTGNGVSIGGTIVGNLVQGNLIGTNVTGNVALGNLTNGVLINFGSLNNTIGGTTPAARNIISGNTGNGIRCDYHPNQMQGNFIGTQLDGASPLGNGSNGIFLNFVGGNTVGGTAGGAGNTIAFNGGDGVLVVTGNANAISSNAIFSNTGLGINLELDGATPNDACDNDSGGNNRQNFPVITSANSSGGSTTIQGTLDSTADTTFRIEFFSNSACDGAGFSEGQNFIGAATVTTNGNCGVSFTINLPVGVASGSFITATAMDADANTSEFARCFLVGTACSYSISPNSRAFPSRGGEGSVTVATSNNCNWTAVSNSAWITLASAASGSGNGVVSYVVRENFANSSRTGTLTIAGQTFTLNQSGDCAFSISPTRKSFASNGGTGTVNVMVSGGCNWTAVSNVGWITINTGSSGTGNGAVTYTVANTTGLRSGTMTIAGQTFTVKQKKP